MLACGHGAKTDSTRQWPQPLQSYKPVLLEVTAAVVVVVLVVLVVVRLPLLRSLGGQGPAWPAGVKLVNG